MANTTNIRNRTEIADYLNIAEKGATTATYAFMGAGFKTLDESPSAQTKSKRYVCDKSSTRSISSYESSFPYELDQIKDEDAVDFIINVGKRRYVGVDAQTDYVRVDLDKPVAESAGEFEARKFSVAIEVASLNNDDGEMTGSGNLLCIGDPIFGKFNVKTKTFTEEETE